MENLKITFEQREKAVKDRLKALKQDQENNGIGNRIREQRIKQGLTGIQLAKLVNMSQSAISDIENGKRNIDSREIPLFAAALDCSVEYLCSNNLALETGLSERAVETLKGLKAFGNNSVSRVLNLLLYSAKKEKGIGIAVETIGQDLLQEISEYISRDYIVAEYENGSDYQGKMKKQYITNRELSIFRIKDYLDVLSKIYKANQQRKK